MKKTFLKFLASLGYLTVALAFGTVGYLMFSAGEFVKDFVTGYSNESCIQDVELCSRTGVIRKAAIDPLIHFFSSMDWVNRNGKGTATWLAIGALFFLLAVFRDFLWIVAERVSKSFSLTKLIQWFLVAILAIVMIPIIFIFAIPLGHLRSRVKIPWGKARKTAIGLLFSTYWEFLSRYVERESIGGILRSHWFFIKHMVMPWLIPSQGKDLAIFLAPFEFRSTVERLNRVIAGFSGGKSYVTNFHADPDVITFTVAENGMSGSQMKANIISNADELKRALPGYSFEGSEFGDPIVETYKDDTGVRFARRALWKIVEPDLNALEIPKGKILLGFYPDTKGGRNTEVKYFIDADSLLHTFVVGTTQHGKDVVMKNFNFSVLKQISTGQPMELHFFDVKTSDGQYLESLRRFGVCRYAERDRFVEALSKLNDRMMERQSKIGIHSNLREYRKAHPNTDMKTVFIVVNELMDLIAGSEKGEADDLIRIFTSLLTKGAGAGFKLVFMAQSMRKDIDPRYGKIFANITTRISVKIVNQEEAEIAGRGLPRDELLRLFSLEKYNAVHIEDGSIKREFRAYNVTQTAILDWIREAFNTEDIFGNPKLDDYYLHAKEVGKLNRKESMEEPFNLSRAEWDELVKQLESRAEIEWKNGLPISFKTG